MPRLSSLVDTKTGKIKKFETAFEKLDGEMLPKVGGYAVLGVKLAVVAPFIGGAAVGLPLAAGAYFGGRWLAHQVSDLMVKHGFTQDYSREKYTYRFDWAPDVRKFKEDYAHLGYTEEFIDDYRKLAAQAGIAPPKLIIADLLFEDEKRKRNPQGMMMDYIAATTSRIGGKGAVILLGRGAIKDLSREELRAVMAHEMTHLALHHPDKLQGRFGRGLLNSMLNVGLFGAAVFGGIGILPALGLVLAGNLVLRATESIQSRHHERMCDRGAALMTGNTAELGTALDKIVAAMKKVQQRENKRLPEPGRLKRFIYAAHPDVPERKSLLAAFNSKNKDYCENKQQTFVPPRPAFG